MAVDRDNVLSALAAVPFPGFTRDVVSLGVIRDVEIRADGVVVRIDAGPAGSNPTVATALESAIREAVERLGAPGTVRVVRGGAHGASPSLNVIGQTPPRPSVAAAGGVGSDLIPEVRYVIAVASGKGGVGKSTVAVNLAVGLARTGLRVGLLDADIYGPSIPLMMGLQGKRPETSTESPRIVPFERYGVRFMSLGFLVDPDSAVIWRGPMVMKALEELLREVRWGALDILVVDMPPGTGDAQLTMAQRVRLAGAVIVTTPQDVALADAIKGVAMFRKVDVPVLGLVENMSYFVCPHCSERSEIFGHGGGRREAERLGVPFLGEVPLDAAIRDSGDRGKPVAVAGDRPQGRAFDELARTIATTLGLTDGDTKGAGDAEAGLFERFRKVWGGSDASG